mgnify:CR=1 FL=1
MPKQPKMTLGEIYQLAIKLGRAADPRGETRVQEILKLEQRRYDELPKDRQKFYDREKLNNPYPDTRILFGATTQPIKTILAGIDMDGPELLVADRLRQRGTPIDAVLAHHPEGIALAQLDDQLTLQTDLLAHYGVPIHIAESLLEERIGELGRALSPVNHNRAIDIARLLDLPFLCTHTATDNLVFRFMKEFVIGKNPTFVKDILDALLELPEYQTAERLGAGPHIVSGANHRRTGTIAFTDITGGTEGAKEVYEYLSKSGVGTVVAMHMKEETAKLAKAAHLNVVVAGHISSDSLGLNLLLDQLEAAGITIISAGGLIRVNRLKPSSKQSRRSSNEKALRPSFAKRLRPGKLASGQSPKEIA